MWGRTRACGGPATWRRVRRSPSPCLRFRRDSRTLTLQGIVALLHPLDDLVARVPIEGRVAAEEDVQDHTAAPHVALLVVVLPQHLRRDVIWLLGSLKTKYSADALAHLARVSPVEYHRRAEVHNLDDRIFSLCVKEQVFGLQIPARDRVITNGE